MRSLRHTAITIAVALLNAVTQATSTKPNIVVILADDQDLHLYSMNHMDILQEQLVQQGTQFTKHYGHVSQCCPARATLWTGRHAHNTNITSVINDVPRRSLEAYSEIRVL